jgi:hypothetical protein
MRRQAFTLIMFVAVMSLLFAVIPACSLAGPVTAEWDLSVDDTYLGTTGGYRLYTGKVSGSLTAETVTAKAGVKTLTVQLPPGRYFGAMTAFTSDGLESAKTTEVSFIVLPGKPTNVRFTSP